MSDLYTQLEGKIGRVRKMFLKPQFLAIDFTHFAATLTESKENVETLITKFEAYSNPRKNTTFYIQLC